MFSPGTFPVAALVLALSAGVSRAADQGSSGAAQVAGVAPGIVDGQTAHKLVAGGVKVVDVRTPSEFRSGHVPGAINIPYDEMPNRYSEIGPPSTPVLLYCRTGHRTAIAMRTLRSQGYATIYDLQRYDKWVGSEHGR